MRPAFNGPEPDDEGLGFGAFVLVLIVIGLLALVVLAQPGTAIFVAVVGLFILASVAGHS